MEITKVNVTGADGTTVEAGYFTSSYDTYLQFKNLSIEPAKQYTLHGYIKASTAGTISCLGVSANVTTSWQEVQMTITPDSKTFSIYFYPAAFYIYNWKLEIGDVASYWTPSPLDAKHEIEEKASEWSQTAEEIKSSVSKVSDDLDNTKAEWSQTAEEIKSSVSKVSDDLSTAETKWTQTANELSTEISKKTDSETVQTLITASADDIRLKTGKLVWEAENSSMTEDGVLTCKDGNFTGDVNAVSMTLGDGDKCVIKWGEDAIKFDDGTVAEIGYRGGANQPHNAMYIGVENVSLVAGVSNDTGTAYTSYASIEVSADGTAYVNGANGIYLNGTNWDTFKSQHGYDWSTFNTENTSDTWVPVMNGSVVNHRVIPSDAFKAQSNGIFRKYGKVVVANFYGTSTSSLPWVPEGWAPTADVSIPVTVMYNSNPYMGYLQIHTGRWMECKYYNYGSGKGTPASGSTIYGVATWIIA